VVLLSIDGFSYQYLTKQPPPNIIALSKLGVVAKPYLKNKLNNKSPHRVNLH
tara:strand:- start:15300 stop:15455 length:156 start_codon:yes stop_codon:yes gene_type:complete